MEAWSMVPRSFSDRFHQLAVARAQLLEVGFQLLDQDPCGIGDILQFLYVHFGKDEVLDRIDLVPADARKAAGSARGSAAGAPGC